MLSFRWAIYRRLGWSCVERRAKVIGNVELGKMTHVADDVFITAQAHERISIGEKCRIRKGAFLDANGGTIEIGHDVTINPYSVIYGPKLTIGSRVLIAAHAILIPANHNFDRLDIPIRQQGSSSRGITIEDDVWLGARVTILDGVRIAHGAVIAAGSVVTRDVPENAVVSGVPAQVIRQRGEVFHASDISPD